MTSIGRSELDQPTQAMFLRLASTTRPTLRLFSVARTESERPLRADSGRPPHRRWDYSIFRNTVDRNHTLKWLFPLLGPQRQVFVAGVEVKATFDELQKATLIRKMP